MGVWSAEEKEKNDRRELSYFAKNRSKVLLLQLLLWSWSKGGWGEQGLQSCKDIDSTTSHLLRGPDRGILGGNCSERSRVSLGPVGCAEHAPSTQPPSHSTPWRPRSCHHQSSLARRGWASDWEAVLGQIQLIHSGVGGSCLSWFASVNCEPVSQLCVQRGQASSLKLAAVRVFTPQESANVPNQGSFPPQKARSPTSPCLYWCVRKGLYSPHPPTP